MLIPKLCQRSLCISQGAEWSKNFVSRVCPPAEDLYFWVSDAHLSKGVCTDFVGRITRFMIFVRKWSENPKYKCLLNLLTEDFSLFISVCFHQFNILLVRLLTSFLFIFLCRMKPWRWNRAKIKFSNPIVYQSFLKELNILSNYQNFFFRGGGGGIIYFIFFIPLYRNQWCHRWDITRSYLKVSFWICDNISAKCSIMHKNSCNEGETLARRHP